jgi:hypothetical protein
MEQVSVRTLRHRTIRTATSIAHVVASHGA